MKKRGFLFLVLMIIMSLSVISCSNEKDSDVKNNKDDLSNHSLLVYCGAGMTNPFQEIADKFTEKYNCKVNVVFANAAQIQTQINTSEEGDLFIAGSKDELAPIEGAVTESKELVKHIPVLAVYSGNPKKINKLEDLTQEDVSLIVGDSESTPIGKIAKKVLVDNKIFDKVNIVANTTTAPQIANIIVSKEADAAIIWKENCNIEGVEIVNTSELDNYIKTVPAATLKYSDDKNALNKFLQYLDTDEAKEIWTKYGYEVLN